MAGEHHSHFGQASVPARLRVRQITWLVFGTSLPLMACLAIAAVLLNVSVPSSTVFQGVLRPDEDPVTVEIPADVTVAHVEVRTGDIVARDDVLFRLDAEMGQFALDRIHLDMRRARYARECALAWPRDPFAARRALTSERQAPSQGDTPMSRQSEPRQVLNEAAAECDLRRAEIASRLFDATANVASLSERLRLLDQKTHLLRRQREKQSEIRRGSAYEAVSLALAHNLTKTELLAAQSDLHAARTRIKRELLENARETAQTLSLLRLREAQLRRHLANPVIRAPFNGTVRRVHVQDHQNANAVAYPAVELIRDGDGYSIALVVPSRVAPFLVATRDFDVTLPDLPGRERSLAVMLVNKDTEPVPGDPDRVRLRLALDDASAHALDSGQTGLALHGQHTRARIELAAQPRKAGATLRAALHALKPGLEGAGRPLFPTDEDRATAELPPLPVTQTRRAPAADRGINRPDLLNVQWTQGATIAPETSSQKRCCEAPDGVSLRYPAPH